MANDLLKKLDGGNIRLSKSHKKIADYIKNNYDKAAFLTASQLGDKVEVSESTVVRFAVSLGFDGYPALQRELQQMIKSKLTAIQRMEVSQTLIGEGDIIKSVLSSDVELIKETIQRTSRDDFNRAVKQINSAKKIYILGVRSSGALAEFLYFYFNLVFDSVIIINTSSASQIYEKMFKINKEDVCIAISFPRYSTQIANAIEFIHDRKAKIIALTDTEKSPIAKYADCLLLARSAMASVVDSIAAPLSLINALIVAVTLTRKDQISKNFNELEKIWEQYQVYEKSDDE